jgi:hypothetical protein
MVAFIDGEGLVMMGGSPTSFQKLQEREGTVRGNSIWMNGDELYEVPGSSILGTVGCQLRFKTLYTTSSHQQQTAEKTYTPYRIWLHHS